MRKFFRGIQAMGVVALALLLAAGAALLLHAPLFLEGKNYELYLSPSSSSLVLLTDDPVRDKLFCPVMGESVRYDGDKKDELIARFRAEILFTEEAAGVTNYYCYSPLIGGGIALNGYTVNLHIATSQEQTAAGSPIIFGGS